MKRPLILVLLLSVAATAGAATSQTVAFQSGEQEVHALLYVPAGDQPHPAMVVIHEWWGLVDWVKDQANNYADQGYVTLAVDLYRGQSATDPDTAHQLARGLPQDRGVRDLVSAVAYLKQRKDVDPTRIGAVGWCMGGGFALQLAIAEPSLRAVAINYGSLATDRAALSRVHAAVLGNFGAQDKGITPADVTAFAATMKSLGNSPNVKEYPQAGHAFENPNNQTGYRASDAADAQQRLRNFFAQTLQK